MYCLEYDRNLVHKAQSLITSFSDIGYLRLIESENDKFLS